MYRLMIYLLLAALASVPPCHAGMEGIPDSELAEMRASAGISLHYSGEISADYLRYENPDNGHYLEYQNVTIEDQSGGPMDTNGDVLLDVGTSGSRSCLAMTLPDTLATGDAINWIAQSSRINGTSSGSLSIENWRHSQTKYMVGSRTDGSTGIDLRLESNWNIESYCYEIGDDEFSLNNLYLSDAPGGNPEFPTQGSGNAILGSGTEWARLDTGTDAAGSYLVLNIPFQGTLRVRNTHIAGNDFGAIVMDEIDGDIRIRTPCGATWQY